MPIILYHYSFIFLFVNWLNEKINMLINVQKKIKNIKKDIITT